jgi:hypothetical protein
MMHALLAHHDVEVASRLGTDAGSATYAYYVHELSSSFLMYVFLRPTVQWRNKQALQRLMTA